MLSWLPRQRARMERIEVEAETMISDFGADAYFEAPIKLEDWAHHRSDIGA